MTGVTQRVTGSMNSDWAPWPTRPSRVVQRRGGDAEPVPVRRRLGLEAQPLTGRIAAQVHGQVGVDEQPVADRQGAGDAVAAVGEHHQPLQAGRLLAGDQRDPLTRPRRGRPGLGPRSEREPQLHRVQEAARPGRAAPGWSSAGIGGICVGEATAGGRSSSASRTRQARARTATRPPADSSASTSSTLRPDRATRLATLTSPTGTGPRISTAIRTTVDGRVDGLVLSGAGQQGRGRPAVLHRGIPGTAGVLGREEAAVGTPSA